MGGIGSLGGWPATYPLNSTSAFWASQTWSDFSYPQALMSLYDLPDDVGKLQPRSLNLLDLATGWAPSDPLYSTSFGRPRNVSSFTDALLVTRVLSHEPVHLMVDVWALVAGDMMTRSMAGSRLCSGAFLYPLLRLSTSLTDTATRAREWVACSRAATRQIRLVLRSRLRGWRLWRAT